MLTTKSYEQGDDVRVARLAFGIIVLVRTFLSFSLDIELDGTLPWQRRPEALGEGRRTVTTAP